MNGSIQMQNLDCYRVAKDIAVRVHEAKIGDSELRDQATRAAKSTFLRLAEGLPHEGAGMRRKYFAEANGSLHEVVAAVDLAVAIGAMDGEKGSAIIGLSAKLKPMIRALMR
jgi:four helix bundle protein